MPTGRVIAIEKTNCCGTLSFARRSEPIVFICNRDHMPAVGDLVRVDQLPKTGEILRLTGER